MVNAYATGRISYHSYATLSAIIIFRETLLFYWKGLHLYYYYCSFYARDFFLSSFFVMSADSSVIAEIYDICINNCNDNFNNNRSNLFGNGCINKTAGIIYFSMMLLMRLIFWDLCFPLCVVMKETIQCWRVDFYWQLQLELKTCYVFTWHDTCIQLMDTVPKCEILYFKWKPIGMTGY